MSFTEQLARGKTGESLIAGWLRRKGYAVLPVYETILEQGKGPQLFLPADRELIAPDMLCFDAHNTRWIEAKHKTAFTWYRITGRWVTGIDLRHYNDYLAVEETSPWPVWLLFLQRGGQAKDSPPSPSGLYGNPLAYLRKHESHRSEKWGRSGMVYWAIDDLRKLATIESVLSPIRATSAAAR